MPCQKRHTKSPMKHAPVTTMDCPPHDDPSMIRQAQFSEQVAYSGTAVPRALAWHADLFSGSSKSRVQ
jgi:hypothetical protein